MLAFFISLHQHHSDTDAKRNRVFEDTEFLSYAFPEVRAWRLAIIQEVLQRDVDGIHIDFCRYPQVLGYEEPQAKSFFENCGEDPRKKPVSDDDPRWLTVRRPVMTDFMREVRRAATGASIDHGRYIGVTVRIDHRYYRRCGLDVEAWMREGLIDALYIGQEQLGMYYIHLMPFLKMAEGTSCLVLASEEAGLPGNVKDSDPGNKFLTLADYCARAIDWYAQGAAGIHLFNRSWDPSLPKGNADLIEALEQLSGRDAVGWVK